MEKAPTDASNEVQIYLNKKEHVIEQLALGNSSLLIVRFKFINPLTDIFCNIFSNLIRVFSNYHAHYFKLYTCIYVYEKQ